MAWSFTIITLERVLSSRPKPSPARLKLACSSLTSLRPSGPKAALQAGGLTGTLRCMEDLCLVGDVGGTKTTLALVSTKQPRSPVAQATYRSQEHRSLVSIIQIFLASGFHRPTRACFAVAGPIFEGRSQITNLDWMIDAAQLQEILKLEKVLLLNDLEAVAWAIPQLQAQDLFALNAGQARPQGAVAVLAPGTGLGEAFLTWEEGHYVVYACEGGHKSFAPADPLQLGLLRHLLEEHHHVSYERVCSGALGIPNIYAYLRSIGRAPEPEWLAQQLALSEDPTPIIVRAALDEENPCALCRETLNVFVSILGSEAGNMVLAYLSTGGVYLAGGIPPRILPLLQGEGFMKAFRNKGRFSTLMASIPVYIVLNPDAGLLGAAHFSWLQGQREQGDDRRC